MSFVTLFIGIVLSKLHTFLNWFEFYYVPEFRAEIGVVNIIATTSNYNRNQEYAKKQQATFRWL